MTRPRLTDGQALTREQAARFAVLPLRNLAREYPNNIAHYLTGPQDARPPRALHPIFYGSYDWHSCVHGWWLLARCLRRHPDLEIAARAEALFAAHFTPEHGLAEVTYFAEPGRASWERPYGWAWLLALAAELGAWRHDRAGPWRAALAPLERHIAAALPAYLAKLAYPIRVGTHFNTAFALILAWRYARLCGQAALARAIADYARRAFGSDRDYPAHYEPGGDDFLSGALCEALLMAELLPEAEFAAWFAGFLPQPVFAPAHVADRDDPKGVHLDGLNLSRAWCLRGIAAKLPDRAAALRAMADAHEAASLPFLESGEYGGEHWLATFAALAIEGLDS
ncbi:MAG TPA: DUF2891 domain-containing protein [Ferrovibrio sp.]|uniref:DUF2891 domain-containing protein n=1 Tax=Ferrovibrio sp. TaxID=1917215 RepID=UPI002ED64F79